MDQNSFTGFDAKHAAPKAQTCAIAVMAKAPQAGRCKTRLVGKLNPEQAARLSAAFLRDVTENIAAASATSRIDALIAYAPLGLEALFDGHLAAGTQLMLADGGPVTAPGVAGFGRCLLHAVQELLAQGYGAACVLNSDSPDLPTEYLARAASLLGKPGDRAVLGPAEDGGYYLLGLKAPHAHLFTDIAWSTENAAAQTAQRAREIGLELVMLPSWYDVDDAAALERLIVNFAGGNPGAYAAPASRACLARFGLLE